MSKEDPTIPVNTNSRSTSQDTGYTFTDDPWIRWRNTWRYFTGGLTQEGMKQYIEGRDDRFEREDCRRCEQQRDFLLQYSMHVLLQLATTVLRRRKGPIVRFMNQKITALGGDLHKGNIRCQRCAFGRSGGFDPNYGILLCANRPEPVEDVLAHGEPTNACRVSHSMLILERDDTCLRFSSLQARLREP